MATIKEAMDRNDIQDQIMIGEVCSRAYRGKFGEVLRAIINAETTRVLVNNEINPSDRMPLNASRLLGRLEGYQKIITQIERAIDVAEQLKQPIEDEDNE